MRTRIALGTVCAVVLLNLSMAGLATAHTVRQFGPYSIAIGWQHEPPFVGVENAVQVFVKDAKGQGISDVSSDNLHVVVSTGNSTSAALPLNATLDPDTGLGTPGEYLAPLIPTAPGDYTFRLQGDIHGTTVDQAFTTSDTTFNPVQTGNAAEFPVQLPALVDLSTKLDRVGARADAAQAAVAQAQADAKQAQDSVTVAQMAASQARDDAARAMLVGVVVGGMGILVALLALGATWRARRRSDSLAPAPSVAS